MLERRDEMGKLLYMMEFVLILVVTGMCSVNTFLTGYNFISTDIVTGITSIVLSVTTMFLPVVYYKFYELLD